MTGSNVELRAALVRAQAAVGSAFKGGRNEKGGWNYASREDIAMAAKQALSEHGLAFSMRGPTDIRNVRTVHIKTKYDNYDCETADLVFDAVLTHDSGEQESWACIWPIEYVKGMQKEQRPGSALSFAYKNTLLSILNIPRSDEEDGDSRDSRDHTPGVQRPPDPDADEKRAIFKAFALDEHKALVKPLAAKYGIEDRDALIAADIKVLRAIMEDLNNPLSDPPPNV